MIAESDIPKLVDWLLSDKIYPMPYCDGTIQRADVSGAFYWAGESCIEGKDLKALLTVSLRAFVEAEVKR